MDRKKFEAAYARGLEKVEYMQKVLPGFPHITKDKQWLTNQNGHWTGGFWTGLLWMDSIYKKDAAMAEAANEWALKLRCRMDDCTTHDQGFIFGPSCVFGYRLNGNPDYVPMIHAGALNMIRQYVPQVGLVQAWAEAGYDGISIVDTMMNLPILMISGELSDDPTEKEFALSVARQIKKHGIRADNSTYHVIRWDENFRIYGDTHQGFAAESCWSRGQTWALYGFANMYRYSGEVEFLDTALALAEYFWNNLNDDHLPAWDFTFRNDASMPIDASAASVAASGMALIASLMARRGDEAAAKLWGERADAILEAEIDHCFYENMEEYGLIRRVVVDYPHGSGIGESSMYGDYYFMEGLYRRLHADDQAALNLLY